jgi:hypothetical protein
VVATLGPTRARRQTRPKLLLGPTLSTDVDNSVGNVCIGAGLCGPFLLSHRPGLFRCGNLLRRWSYSRGSVPVSRAQRGRVFVGVGIGVSGRE